MRRVLRRFFMVRVRCEALSLLRARRGRAGPLPTAKRRSSASYHQVAAPGCRAPAHGSDSSRSGSRKESIRHACTRSNCRRVGPPLTGRQPDTPDSDALERPLQFRSTGRIAPDSPHDQPQTERHLHPQKGRGSVVEASLAAGHGAAFEYRDSPLDVPQCSLEPVHRRTAMEATDTQLLHGCQHRGAGQVIDPAGKPLRDNNRGSDRRPKPHQLPLAPVAGRDTERDCKLPGIDDFAGPFPPTVRGGAAPVCYPTAATGKRSRRHESHTADYAHAHLIESVCGNIPVEFKARRRSITRAVQRWGRKTQKARWRQRICCLWVFL